MRRRSVILAGAALLIAQLGCAAGELSEAERGRVEEEASAFVESLFAAMNTHDVEAIAGHYDQGPEFVYVGCTAVRVGFENVRRLMEAWNNTNPEVTFDPEILATRVLDRNAAAVTARALTSQDVMLFWTFTLQRNGEAWRIVYEHESWADCPDRRPHPSIDRTPAGPESSGGEEDG